MFGICRITSLQTIAYTNLLDASPEEKAPFFQNLVLYMTDEVARPIIQHRFSCAKSPERLCPQEKIHVDIPEIDLLTLPRNGGSMMSAAMHYNSGIKLLKNGDHFRAGIEFNLALESGLLPERFQNYAYNAVGDILMHDGQIKEAARYYFCSNHF